MVGRCVWPEHLISSHLPRLPASIFYTPSHLHNFSSSFFSSSIFSPPTYNLQQPKASHLPTFLPSHLLSFNLCPMPSALCALHVILIISRTGSFRRNHTGSHRIDGGTNCFVKGTFRRCFCADQNLTAGTTLGIH